MSLEGDRNCISLVMSYFGVVEKDNHIAPADAMKVMGSRFEAADPEKAQVLMVYYPLGSEVLHLALIDPSNHSYVVHRPKCGANARKDALDIALGPYQKHIDKGVCKVEFLRFRGDTPYELPRMRPSVASFLPKFIRKCLIKLQSHPGDSYSF